MSTSLTQNMPDSLMSVPTRPSLVLREQVPPLLVAS
jgi:hypothetical protein